MKRTWFGWALLLTSGPAWTQQYVISTVAGGASYGYSGDGGPAASARLYVPVDVAVDKGGNIYVADSFNNRVRKISPSGVITTVAGNGTPGFSGDGGPATSAQLFAPFGVAVDASGNLFIADQYNNRVRRVSSMGIITTIAGSGVQGYSGDGGTATNAALNYPVRVALDGGGNVYIADRINFRVRKISSTGAITTVAGNGTNGYSGDGGPATSAQISFPGGIAVDGGGNLYMADPYNHCVRKVSSTGIITTVALSDTQVGLPWGVSLDTSGKLYISDPGSSRILTVSSSGTVTTIAGNGTRGYSGDGGAAVNAKLSLPWGVAVDSRGNVYLADAYNNAPGAPDSINAVRLLQPSAFILSTMTNAASNLPGSVSAGEIVVLSGSGLGPGQLTQCPVTNQGNIGIQCAGTTVSFNGAPAPVIYTWATQVAAIVPYSLSGTAAQVTVTYQGQTTPGFAVNVASVAPGLFTLDSTGKGQAAAINQDGSINTAGHPAPTGSYLSLFATGEGQTSPQGVDGKPAQVPLPLPLAPVTVTIGGRTVTPQYAGGAPGQVAGLMQINVQIPSGIQTGNAVPVTVQVGSASTQAGVTIAIQ